MQRDGCLSQDRTLDQPSVKDAYAVCRAIARREAKNFYYAFVALPSPRRNAICAIYAFMRKADDHSDDETVPREERRLRIEQWMAEWHALCHGGHSTDPVFTAVRDATQRFGIPLRLLDELAAGTAMDLEQDSTCGPDTYATFEDLYRYCYLVASVVGLVCIRIFGYADARAEKLAEETGIAFQLTNILRDVAEDAARNRIYLPLEDLAAHGISPESLQKRAAGAPVSAAERALLGTIAMRAERYYESTQRLVPLIERESRPALWVLVEIYHALLKRIERSGYDVFSRRISVPMVQKLGILGVGLLRLALARIGIG